MVILEPSCRGSWFQLPNFKKKIKKKWTQRWNSIKKLEIYVDHNFEILKKHLTLPGPFHRSLKRDLFTKIFEKSQNREKTTKNQVFLKNHSFWTIHGDPPKIIKNRLNFALSEKFTYVRNHDFWWKIQIFLKNSKKIKFFFAFFSNHRFSLIFDNYGDFRTELSRVMVSTSQIWSKEVQKHQVEANLWKKTWNLRGSHLQKKEPYLTLPGPQPQIFKKRSLY